MSEAPAVPAVPTHDGQPATTDNPPAPVAAPAQEPTDWKAEARKWETQSKANKTAADELAALKAAQMTETEKSAARLADLESKVKGYETKEQVAAWKAKVSETSGVPAAALAGSTLEEIEAHAATLKPLIAPADGKRPTVGPYVPPEGSAPGGAVQSPGDQFAEFIDAQLKRP